MLIRDTDNFLEMAGPYFCFDVPGSGLDDKTWPYIIRFPIGDSVPSRSALGASLLPSAMKASPSWFFCRLSLMNRAVYSPAPVSLLAEDRLGLRPSPDYFARC